MLLFSRFQKLKQAQLSVLRVSVFVLALLPFLRLLYAAWHNDLGANPLEFITRNTGDWALYFLCMTLAITPLRRWLDWPWLLRLRRMLGLYCFFYASCHFLSFLWFDHFFEVEEMWRDVLKRPFITMGFGAFVLLVPLALTSTQWAMRKLGGKYWQILHKAVYGVAVLALLHYFWMRAGKNNFAQPIFFAAIILVLFGVRLFWRWKKSRN